MGCNTKDNSLIHLKAKGIIGETREVAGVNLKAFRAKNRYLTAVAASVHGLETGGKMLFTEESTTHKTISRDWLFAQTNTVMRAVPVDELFNELDKIIDEKNTKDEILMEEMRARGTKLRVVSRGYRHYNEDVVHFTETSEDSGAPNSKSLVSNENLLNQKEDSVLFDNWVREYELRTGYKFNINRATEADLENQKKFYDFLKHQKGLRGMEVYNFRGELQLLLFNQPSKKEVLEEDPKLKLEDFQDEEFKDTEIPKSRLETQEFYDSTEAATILKTYTLSEVNDMLSDDKKAAVETFNTLLYGNGLKSDIFVSDRDLNEQLNKCK